MSEAGEAASWKRAPRWMKLLVIVSLLGNAVVAGVVGGALLRGDKILAHQTRPEPGLSRQQTRILHMVPEARREWARNILLARGNEIEAARVTMETAQAEMLAAIRAEPFVAERLAAALAERRAAGAVVWGAAYEQLGEIVAGLGPAERAALADALEERYRRWAERRQTR